MRPRPFDYFKRGIDIVGAATGLIVLSPVIAATAILVRVKLGAPVLFVQPRPGRGGRIFRLYKFRSMHDVDESRGLIEDEERLPPFGQRLRATSLDELPSLWNVLVGDMSLVGPRPLKVEYLERYTAFQSRRHEVRPGITGLAQVNGRNEASWEDRFRCDVEYVDQRSLSLDAQILLRTVTVTLSRRGVSADGHVTIEEFRGTQA